MADQVGYRNFLTKEKGIKDEDITYNNGSIYVKNKHFADATPQEDGSTYGTREGINKAFNAYTNAGYQDDARNVLNQVQQRINTPPPQFNYNRDTDPLYQDARKSAQMNAQTAGNNASVRLGARGIGNSQQALTTENQIQQREFGQLERNIAPQLYAQAYKQYQDKYAMEQDGLKNLLGLSKTYNDMYNQGRDEEQQVFNNERLIKADNLNAARNVGNDLGRVIMPKDDWSNLYNQDDAPLNFDGQKYKDDIAQREKENQYKEATQAIQQQNANRLSAGGSSKGGASSGKPMSSAQFNDIFDTLQKKYGVVEYKKDSNDDVITDANGNPTISYMNTNNPDQKAKIVLEILNAELSDDDTLKLLNKMGITEKEARELLGG